MTSSESNCMRAAKWISSGRVNEKACSLPPETYQKTFHLDGLPAQAKLTVTALGIYEAYLNGKKVGEDFFTPGYTNYKSHIQVQEYDVSALLKEGENVLEVTVANGWYLGRIGNQFNVYGNCRALLAELALDGAVIPTDESWRVTLDGPVRFADFYDGETIDLRKKERQYFPVQLYAGKTPKLLPHFGTFVRAQEALVPVGSRQGARGTIYDFGQNFAGVVRLKVRAKEGTCITVRHAEILMDGKLFNENYRTAKAALTLIAREGENEFFPTFTYMGFRYAEISGDKPIEVLSVEGVVYSSEMRHIGSFACSDERLNRLQSCLVWNLKSNFVEIPTDCPQRDERLGWTGGDMHLLAHGLLQLRHLYVHEQVALRPLFPSGGRGGAQCRAEHGHVRPEPQKAHSAHDVGRFRRRRAVDALSCLRRQGKSQRALPAHEGVCAQRKAGGGAPRQGA